MNRPLRTVFGITALNVAFATPSFAAMLSDPLPGKVLLIPDAQADVVAAFDPYDGAYLGDFINGTGILWAPTNAVQGPDGNIYVSDPIADAVFVYDQSGAFLSVYADATDGLNNIRGIDFRGGHLFVTSGDAYVAEFSGPHARLADYINDTTDVFDVTFLPDGSCVTAVINGTQGVRLYDPSGTFVSLIDAGAFPQQISVDSQLPGDLLCAYFSAAKCDDFDTAGVLTKKTPSSSQLRGCYRLGNGNLLLTSLLDGVIEVNPMNGVIVNSIRFGSSWGFIEEVSFGPWTNLCQALPGGWGTPVLEGAGKLTSGSTVAVSLTNAATNKIATLIVGTPAVDLPLFGGTLVPNASFLIPVPTGPTGTVTLGTVLPPGIVPGIPIYLQFWIEDPSAPQGYSASNAITATTE